MQFGLPEHGSAAALRVVRQLPGCTRGVLGSTAGREAICEAAGRQGGRSALSRPAVLRPLVRACSHDSHCRHHSAQRRPTATRPAASATPSAQRSRHIASPAQPQTARARQALRRAPSPAPMPRGVLKSNLPSKVALLLGAAGAGQSWRTEPQRATPATARLLPAGLRGLPTALHVEEGEGHNTLNPPAATAHSRDVSQAPRQRSRAQHLV
jgi:hypothetical protein